jgi:4-nitrophenyl phosphatase
MNKNPKICGLILDMDGVLWRGPEPLGNLKKIFETIEEKGLKVTLATNNATRSVSQYLEKLRTYGVSLDPQQIINSGMTTAEYLQDRYPPGQPVYVIGDSGLLETLADSGFNHTEDHPVAVIVSMDREFTYQKLAIAQRHILSGAIFIGTNPDLTFPNPEGLTPGAGSLIAAVQAATGVEPVMIGKPQPAMFHLALERLGCLPEHTLVVGDRLETDIAGGQAADCMTALVLSGVTTLRSAQAWKPAPTFIEKDLTTLLHRITNGRP